LLKGNYPDAKARLRQCLSLAPSPLVRGFALNNLAVASWWHKSPSEQKSEEQPKIEYTLSQIDNDFKFVIPLLKKAIRSFEEQGRKEYDPEKLERFEGLLDVESIMPKKPENEVLLDKKETGIALMNIGEFLFMNFPDKRNVVIFFLIIYQIFLLFIFVFIN
jgi:hypothetical protein